MFYNKFLFWIILLGSDAFYVPVVNSHSTKDVVAQVKPSVVGGGIYDALGAQTHKLHGTGFVFGDGTLIATNFHVIDQELDITAYPGNSGSSLHDAHNGKVVGILNKVFVKESKESVLEKPSGISYAIPVKYLIELAKREGLEVK
ncbi:hypothetical protein [Paraglaciecola sp.]|uniref:hypothetical protein n=1 Tax=Paraglaciecola sp. TaxID=1920173 RepID=UPI003EF4AA48